MKRTRYCPQDNALISMLNFCKARKAQRELVELQLSKTSGPVPEAYRPDETCTHDELAQMPARQLADGGRLKRTAQTQHARKAIAASFYSLSPKMLASTSPQGWRPLYAEPLANTLGGAFDDPVSFCLTLT